MSAGARATALPLLLLAVVLALAGAFAAGWASTPRAVLAVAFLLACPGLAIAPLIGLAGVPATLTVAVVLSISLDTIVAAALLYAGAWSPATAFAILASVTVAGAAAQIAARADRGAA